VGPDVIPPDVAPPDVMPPTEIGGPPPRPADTIMTVVPPVPLGRVPSRSFDATSLLQAVEPALKRQAESNPTPRWKEKRR